MDFYEDEETFYIYIWPNGRWEYAENSHADPTTENIRIENLGGAWTEKEINSYVKAVLYLHNPAKIWIGFKMNDQGEDVQVPWNDATLLVLKKDIPYLGTSRQERTLRPLNVPIV